MMWFSGSASAFGISKSGTSIGITLELVLTDLEAEWLLFELLKLFELAELLGIMLVSG